MTRSSKGSASSRGSRSKPPAKQPKQLAIDLGTAHPALVRAIAEAFSLCAPPPNLKVSEWADLHRVVSPEVSPEPGPWRTDRVPYMREIMDTYNDPTVRETVVIKGTQVAYTESLLNIVGYAIDVEPCPMLWLLPDEKSVQEMSKNRLTPMLRDTPRLAGKIKAPRSRDSSNTIYEKQFAGGRLNLVGSHAPSQLASRPVRLVIEDENDRFAESAGAEGDPSTLAAKRQAWFWNRKTIKGSSPTVKGRSKIERDYNASDKRVCYVPCPHCAHEQVLRWVNVKWDKLKSDKGKTVEHRPHTAAYQCEECGVLWDDADRWQAIKSPRWQATAPFRGIAGFHLSQFYSPTVKLAEMVTEFLTAYGKLPGTHPDQGKQIVFTNTVLAETWEETGETVDASMLTNRGEPYGPDDLPDGVLFATAGVDVQGNRLEVQILGFGFAEETWAIAYHVLVGDPAQQLVWNELDALLREPMTTVSGRLVRVRAAAIDTGGHHAHQVYEFCRPRFARRIYAIKGRDGPNVIFPKRSTRTKTNQQVWLVGVDTAKDTIYGRLKIKRNPEGASPGYIHFPLMSVDDDSFGADYFNQLTSEQAVTRYRNGKPYRVWELPSGKRNEGLDTFVYALAARHSLAINLDRPHAQPLKPSEEEIEAAPPPAVQAAVVAERRSEPTPRAVSPILKPQVKSRAGVSRMAQLALMQRR